MNISTPNHFHPFWMAHLRTQPRFSPLHHSTRGAEIFLMPRHDYHDIMTRSICDILLRNLPKTSDATLAHRHLLSGERTLTCANCGVVVAT
ncbi:hypothetical protein AVEN_217457-1 [Araneus ventricosus]|uniref:Uncharacterized protein n=1 Tax=Araneus ventricosus TaxID=182803 RepID=A0A4Y2JNH5_ARAVE|nr:hypothetical protein AVEN_217457-1 [Araneus ventricosus]